MRKDENFFLHVGGPALSRTLWNVSYPEVKPGGWVSNLYNKSESQFWKRPMQEFILGM